MSNERGSLIDEALCRRRVFNLAVSVAPSTIRLPRGDRRNRDGSSRICRLVGAGPLELGRS